jgi:membrane-associated phospholipid phosphatase
MSVVRAFLHRAPFDHGKRILLWMISGAIVLYFYGVSKAVVGHTTLPMTAIDLAIPLMPWTIWVYGSGSKAALVGWLLVPDAKAGRRLLWTLATCCAVAALVFVTFPTTYPRELYPLPAGDSATLREFADLRGADSPTNCLPSLHVALAWGLALNVGSWMGRGRVIPYVWALLVSIGTLTTKQHYFVDVPTGAALGWGAYVFAGRAVAGLPFAGSFALDLADPRPAEALLARVRAHQWTLADVPWPDHMPPLPPLLVRLLNEVIYVEEIARLNFELLRDASASPTLRELYGLYADEERRHADGLRLLLERSGAALQMPGLGNSLVLDQFDTLVPAVDGPLVAVSTPVFETFLDAGTIPFLKDHPALRSPAFDTFVERVCTDEAAHIALNWIVIRDLSRRLPRATGLKLLFNPNIFRGMLAVPFMSLEVYAVAHRLGYDFGTLLPPFGRLWRLHERYPELAGFPLWWPYRVFVVAGWVATIVSVFLVKTRLIFADLWVGVAALTGMVARLVFGAELLRRRGLPEVPKGPSASVR